MSIVFDESRHTFKLDTPGTSYIMQTADGFLGHSYYGRRINDTWPGDMMRIEEAPFVPSENERERCAFNDAFPFEYPAEGAGDYRETALKVREENGAGVCVLKYRSHSIYKGKKPICGMPSTFAGEDEADTLEILLQDEALGLDVVLYYTAFRDTDVITRHVSIANKGSKPVKLEKCLSAVIDIDGMDYDTISLHGSWGRERMIVRRPVTRGKFTVSSKRGETSHQDHCFIGICAHDATEDSGEVYGLHFVYSGNFEAFAEGTQFDRIRAGIGINPDNFTWTLNAGETFETPETVMTYSCGGIGKMTRTYHDIYRKHMIRSKYKYAMRPVLINNWEATYFDFNTEKLLSIAEEAKKCGIEMLVMDDGWFGKRDADNCSLGDWTVNEDKLPGGLHYLVSRINEIGLKFGIWMEPEMISPDSDLYRAHPDWAIRTASHEPVLSREQLVLDITKAEVLEYVWNCVRTTLNAAHIEYLKWDMNRQLSDLPDTEISHKYVLAVYELQERLVREYPELLLENCSGGGARFDPGMLYYSPQIWCSDDTDAVERLKIQHGTSLLYPLSTMGAHVSDCPNHATGRVTPFDTRGIVALAGTFGYELDITKISEEDRNRIPAQIEIYHKYSGLYREGDYYRIASFEDNNDHDAYMVVSRDRSEALVTYVQVLFRINQKSARIKLKGLDEDALYQASCEETPRSGASFMYAGLNVTGIWGDADAHLIELKKI